MMVDGRAAALADCFNFLFTVTRMFGEMVECCGLSAVTLNELLQLIDYIDT